MASRRASGWLILVDIGGYTSFLTGAELEHAHAILEDLMRSLLVSLRAPLRFVKLEGDAVFSWADAAEITDVRQILGLVEDAYHAFRMELLNIGRSSTCTCNACKTAPSLSLKAIVHRGEFMVSDLTGTEDLAGPDVILVHRLLKNDVTAKTGKPAYVLLTAAARGDLACIEHAEEIEHLGTVSCGVRCLDEALAALVESGVAEIRAEDADFEVTFEVPARPAVAWAWSVDEDKVARWNQGMTLWKIAPNAAGRTGPGSTIHCAHGGEAQPMKMVGWRPFSSYTTDSEAHGWMQPAMRFTAFFEPLGADRTLVRWRGRLNERTLGNRLFAKVLQWAIARLSAKSAGVLAKLLDE